MVLDKQEVRAVMSSTTVRLTRKELYEEIWKISVAGVSKKYGIPYARCLAKIKAAQIPVPPSGYWTKLNFGKSVEQPPLSGDGDAVVELLQETLPSTADAKKTEQVLPLQEETASEPSSASSPVDTPPQKPPEVETAQMNVTPPETIEKFGQAYNVYHRETLYQEVWAMPVTEVAKRYKVSDAAIHKICKSLDIPTPPQGYWAKLRAGKPVKKLPLPPGKEQTKLGIQTGISRLANPQTTTASLEFLPEEERQVVLNVAAQILLPQEHARMRPEIVAHRKRIAEWNKRKRQQERKFDANWNRGRREVPPPFAEGVSEEQQPRIFRLIDALAKAMVPLGWRLTEDLRFAREQDAVTLTFSESTDQILHTPTKEENLKLLEYEEARKKHSWATKPQIRKYDSVYNGRLSLCVNGTRTFRDCRSYVLEDRLGDMMLSIYGEAEQVKQARLAREEAERQRQEQERKREERRQRYNEEVDRTLALVNCASDYEIACRIRSYVSAMEKAHADQDLSAWASWARAKADWYDPTIAKEDELLGKREHEKSQESKGPQHKGYRW